MNRQKRREDARKSGKKQPRKTSTAAIDRMLLASNTERLSPEALLMSRLKLHVHLHVLLERHDAQCVRYMQHFLNHMRTMLLVRPRPPLHEWADRAEAELAASHTDAPRTFRWLKALVCRFDEEMGSTSAHLLLEANNHAAAVGVLGHILAIIGLPDRTADAIDDMLKGKSLTAIANGYDTDAATIKSEIFEMAYHLHQLHDPESNQSEPATLAELRRQKTHYLAILDKLNSIAGSATAQICDFKRLFEVSLVDIDHITRQLGRQTEAEAA